MRGERPPKILRIISEFEGKAEQPASEFRQPEPPLLGDRGRLARALHGSGQLGRARGTRRRPGGMPIARPNRSFRRLSGPTRSTPGSGADRLAGRRTGASGGAGGRIRQLENAEAQRPGHRPGRAPSSRSGSAGVVDLAENSAHAAPNPYPVSAFCTLLGQHQTFNESTLAGLYGNYGEYVEQVKADTEKLVGEGFLLPEGAQRIVDSAEEFPRLPPTAPVLSGSSTTKERSGSGGTDRCPHSRNRWSRNSTKRIPRSNCSI